MSNLIRNIIKCITPSFIAYIIGGYIKIKRRNPTIPLLSLIFNSRVILPNKRIYYKDDYVRQFIKIANNIHVDPKLQYVYPYDSKLLRINRHSMICSITVDFGKVLQSDLRDLVNQLHNSEDASFKERELRVISSIEHLSNRILQVLRAVGSERSVVLSGYFSSMLYRTPKSLDEALQKLLFYNALFWQMGHYHIGLGRLDLILNDYYLNDLEAGVITENYAKEMIRDFIMILGKDTLSKSNGGLLGDTGQYIMLGGIDSDNINVDNDLTRIFIEVITELKIPDPKLILRVNKDTSDSLWHESIKCIMTGIGSPLIMNEAPIMKRMVSFGYKDADVWNVGTSACWEPLIIGKSFDQNNPFNSAIAVKPLNDLVLSGRPFNSFCDLYEEYKRLYKSELESVITDVNFDCSPLFTLFFDDCIKREKDFTDGGAVYANHGLQVVSLPNAVNALLNIKWLVFEEKKFSLNDCKKAIETNYVGMDDLYVLLSKSNKKFGSIDDEVIDLTNNIISFTSRVVNGLKCNGRAVKVGFSSPNFIALSKNFPPSLDGRKRGDPFAVHVSPISSKIGIPEILEFSTKLDFGDNCINGNVVDFILPSSYIVQSDKLIGILKNACSKDLFELQLNVLDKKILIDAKRHPEKYPNLIVRVWGFSAYFNDLPEEYKDNLICRAEMYECA